MVEGKVEATGSAVLQVQRCRLRVCVRIYAASAFEGCHDLWPSPGEGTSAVRRASETRTNVARATSYRDWVLQTDHCGSIAEQLASDVNLKLSPIAGGDLVAVQVGSYDPKYAVDSQMQYFIIICKLKPEVRTDTHVFSADVTR